MTRELVELLHNPVTEAAIGLLGWRLRSGEGGAATEVILTEVEAYGGASDPASHAYRGPTKRNVSMFLGAGALYVYRSYGIHWCANAVVGPAGEGGAVLLRAGRPTMNRPAMEARRGRTDHLTDGPGKLCEAMGIDGSHDGTSLVDGPIRLLPPVGRTAVKVQASPRIGISQAVDLCWRFTIAGSDT
ncbi:MAG: DNA-3-methyladenine glycosylase [Acidimicrobiia bacterium]|nr:DNA-3-methyladenine glycosylase [Acidimicrobiia bacterium]